MSTMAICGLILMTPGFIALLALIGFLVTMYFSTILNIWYGIANNDEKFAMLVIHCLFMPLFGFLLLMEGVKYPPAPTPPLTVEKE
jgi:hypothetical protein